MSSIRNPTPLRPNYLPTLDGWRAISIALVMLHHSAQISLGHWHDSWCFDHGNVGVDVFFAISGILICSRLIKEEQEFGQISLSSFYIRRAMRILPPAVLYLLTIAVLSSFSLTNVKIREWLGSLFFARNYTSIVGVVSPLGWFTNHFWSLAVEEHFYLMLPFILVATAKRLRIVALLSLIVVVAASCAYQLQSRPWMYIQFHSDVRLNSLLIPASIAVFASRYHRPDRLRRTLTVWPVLMIAVGVLVTFWSGSFWQVQALALLMPLMVLGSVLNPTSLLGKFLELAPLRYVGRISYSLYLWQQLFFLGHFATSWQRMGPLQQWPLCLMMTFICATLSYYLVERPCIKLGHRIASRWQMTPPEVVARA